MAALFEDKWGAFRSFDSPTFCCSILPQIAPSTWHVLICWLWVDSWVHSGLDRARIEALGSSLWLAAFGLMARSNGWTRAAWCGQWACWARLDGVGTRTGFRPDQVSCCLLGLGPAVSSNQNVLGCNLTRDCFGQAEDFEWVDESDSVDNLAELSLLADLTWAWADLDSGWVWILDWIWMAELGWTGPHSASICVPGLRFWPVSKSSLPYS